jgi:hypothetical protein
MQVDLMTLDKQNCLLFNRDGNALLFRLGAILPLHSVLFGSVAYGRYHGTNISPALPKQ